MVAYNYSLPRFYRPVSSSLSRYVVEVALVTLKHLLELCNDTFEDYQ